MAERMMSRGLARLSRLLSRPSSIIRSSKSRPSSIFLNPERYSSSRRSYLRSSRSRLDPRFGLPRRDRSRDRSERSRTGSLSSTSSSSYRRRPALSSSRYRSKSSSYLLRLSPRFGLCPPSSRRRSSRESPFTLEPFGVTSLESSSSRSRAEFAAELGLSNFLETSVLFFLEDLRREATGLPNSLMSSSFLASAAGPAAPSSIAFISPSLSAFFANSRSHLPLRWPHVVFQRTRP
mmetsp:Transcript_15487/g.36473  ORF Transcript_15487/g.36473 Transcript_15487/m.36473 type:complete len:235 (+) Transcript_15487:396-1100(+)